MILKNISFTEEFLSQQIFPKVICSLVKDQKITIANVLRELQIGFTVELG